MGLGSPHSLATESPYTRHEFWGLQLTSLCFLYKPGETEDQGRGHSGCQKNRALWHGEPASTQGVGTHPRA